MGCYANDDYDDDDDGVAILREFIKNVLNVRSCFLFFLSIFFFA
jgi:hypothetical protein